MTNPDPDPSVIYGLLLQVGNGNGQETGSIIILSFAVIVLLLMSALVSGSEVAFFSLDRKELEKENGRFESLVDLLSNPKKLLATILILNNFINIGIVTLMTYLTFLIFGNDEGSQGYLVTAITFITTFIIVFFGEVLPKVYANQNNLVFALRLSGFLRLFNFIFTPFSWMLVTFTQVIEKRIHPHKTIVTKKDISKAIDIATDEDITKEEKDILKGIVNFGQISVKQILRSRIDVTAFDLDTDFHELMNRINKTSFSRYPVYEETIDKIKGVLYIKDLLPHIGNDEYFKWQELIRDAYFVPESKMIDDLLEDFQSRHIHMAIVVDEYGGTSGIVTLEDVIEEIVGEINDEFDDEDIIYTRLNDNAFIFEGKTSIHDFCKVIEIDNEFFDEVKGESESLGGLMLELFERIPRVGDDIQYENYHFTVQSVNTKRVKRIKVDISKPEFSNDAA